MRFSFFYKIIVSFALLLATSSVLAWNHDISIGYGGGEDLNHPEYNNYGGIISAQLLTLKQKNWMHLTFGGSLGTWYSAAAQNKNLFTAALTFSFRAYAFQSLNAHPYFLIATGPAYLSSRKFGENTQGANVAFQSSLGPGIELGKSRRVDLSVKLVHYSNAYTMNPNDGFNILYVTSLGYLF